jgi:hypothetical protein
MFRRKKWLTYTLHRGSPRRKTSSSLPHCCFTMALIAASSFVELYIYLTRTRSCRCAKMLRVCFITKTFLANSRYACLQLAMSISRCPSMIARRLPARLVCNTHKTELMLIPSRASSANHVEVLARLWRILGVYLLHDILQNH